MTRSIAVHCLVVAAVWLTASTAVLSSELPPSDPDAETAQSQTSAPSVPTDDTAWHFKSVANKTLGADANNYFCIVGMPKSCICQITSGTPAYSEKGHDFFYAALHPAIFMEVEYSDEGSTIRRFRFIEKLPNSNDLNKYGGWQTENARQHITDFSSGVDYVRLDWAKDRFVMPFGTSAFDSKTWRMDEVGRRWVLFDIAHCYLLIGASHNTIVTTLGGADYRSSTQAETDSKFDYVDNYILMRGSVGVTSVLKIAYKNDRVVAFRISSR